MGSSDSRSTKKLIISKTTIKNLTVRSGIKTGLPAGEHTDVCTEECAPSPPAPGGGTPPGSCICRGYPYTGYY